MKLSEFCINLERLIKKHPEVLRMDVITSSDDEGNDFNRVFYSSSMGYFNNENNDFMEIGEFEENPEPGYKLVVCLN